MRKSIDEIFPRDVANRIKMDSNDMELRLGIDLIKLLEEGAIMVIGEMDGQILYQATSECLEALSEKAQVV
jgi:hypothetical protein